MGIMINLNIKYKDYLKKKLEQCLQPYEGCQDGEEIQKLMNITIGNAVNSIMKKFKLTTEPHCLIKIKRKYGIIQKITVEFKEVPNEWLNCCEN